MLVVGAGPAGSVAALVLARAGVRVRLVDRAQFPRDKLCGDTLNPGVAGDPRSARQLGDRRSARRALPITGMTRDRARRAQVTADYPDGLSARR